MATNSKSSNENENANKHHKSSQNEQLDNITDDYELNDKEIVQFPTHYILEIKIFNGKMLRNATKYKDR